MKDTAVMCYVRANPPTKVHHQLFKRMIQDAKDLNADPLIFLSKKYDAKMNPIPWELRVKYIKDILSIFVCDDEQIESFIDALIFIHKHQYKKVYVMVSNDKVKEVSDLVNRLNDEKELFEFDKIKVVSTGDYDPDADLADSDYSTAKARNAVFDRDANALSKIVMARNMADVKALVLMMMAGMGLTEHVIPKRRLYHHD